MNKKFYNFTKDDESDLLVCILCGKTFCNLKSRLI